MFSKNEGVFQRGSYNLPKPFFIIVFVLAFSLIWKTGYAQFRQLHVESAENDIHKISFYTPAEGYVAFTQFIGFTADSGRTFTERTITNTNVNFNGNSVNLTFGFEIMGVKAFSRNKVIAYGNYGLIPAILYSTDQGQTFKLVFHSQYNQTTVPHSGITDMVFPSNGQIGYAVNADQILKTTDGGQTWQESLGAENKMFTSLQALDDNHVYAFSSYIGQNMFATANGGADWTHLEGPENTAISSLFFISPTKGLLNTKSGGTYITNDSGVHWVSNLPVFPFTATKMLFVNDNTGYALTDGYEIYKTTDAGRIWEKLPRNNAYTYLNYGLSDMQILGNNIWIAGGHGYVALTTNGGGGPIPISAFQISPLASNGTVNLINNSKTGYSYKWLINGKAVSTNYNASYTPDVYRAQDTIQLIVTNGRYADTSVNYTNFSKGISVRYFSPNNVISGTTVTIQGANFDNITGVSFGGVPAKSFQVANSGYLTAVVGKGASGNVMVTSAKSSGSLGGFIWIPPPAITSFSPTSALPGTTVVIKGTGFNNIYSVYFGSLKAKSFTVVSSTQINAVVDDGLSGDIVINGDAGTGSASGFKVLPLITSVDPATGNYGSYIRLDGGGFADVNAVTVDGFPVKSFNPYGRSLDVIIGDGTKGVIKVTTPYGSYTFNGFTYYRPPQISSFTPMAAPAGATVSITGLNFGTVPTENLVYFGAVKAQVLTATATTLTVTVPKGATYAPITVSAHQNTAYSNMPFTLTFAGGGTITQASFGGEFDFFPGNEAGALAVGDMDGDGLPEIIKSSAGDGVSIHLKTNQSTPGNLKFGETEIRNSTRQNDGAYAAAVADFNFDGQLDIAYVGVYGGYQFMVDRLYNIGPANFGDHRSSVSDLQYGQPATIELNDMDGDGMVDNVAGYKYLFQFANATLGDMDGDGKADVLERIGDSIAVYRNISTKGNIDYAPKVEFYAGAAVNDIRVGDFDRDGKLDFAADAANNTVIIFKGTGSPGNITFKKALTINNLTAPQAMCVGDLDGDGKIELVVAANDKVQVFKNTSTAAAISFAKQVELPVNGNTSMVICDFDGDGRPDLAGNERYQETAWVLRNLIGGPQVIAFSPGGGATGTTVNITGTGFTGATGVTIGGKNVQSFKVNSATSITAVVGQDSIGYVSVMFPNETAGSIKKFIYVTQPVIAAYTPLAFDYPGSVSLDAIPAVDGYTYKWTKDGVTIPGATSPAYNATETGSYTVSVSFEQSAVLTSLPVLVRSVFNLPVDNYKIAIQSATCKGSNNGAISITAVNPLKYTATISGNGTGSAYPFTSSASITGLAAGTYQVTITIEGQPDYKKIFDAVVAEPKDLSVYATVNKSLNSINLQLDGASVYNISLNGEMYTTSAAAIDLPLAAGTNKLSISTDKLCQGIIEKLVNLSDELKPYPNPFQSVLNINIGNTVIAQTKVTISDLKFGRALYSKQYTGKSGVLQLDVATLQPGLYVVSVMLDNRESLFKIIKQ
ncbi:MAG: hypothetical protein JWQ57_1889 [Mucilaginibacter sp.]|nr:hypothetical protein [Mucilaginibacter sp.]